MRLKMLYWVGCGLNLAGVWGRGEVMVISALIEPREMVNKRGKLPSSIVTRISVFNL